MFSTEIMLFLRLLTSLAKIALQFVVHLNLQPLNDGSDDEDTLPSLKRPHLCCPPKMTIHHLCKVMICPSSRQGFFIFYFLPCLIKCLRRYTRSLKVQHYFRIFFTRFISGCDTKRGRTHSNPLGTCCVSFSVTISARICIIWLGWNAILVFNTNSVESTSRHSSFRLCVLAFLMSCSHFDVTVWYKICKWPNWVCKAWVALTYRPYHELIDLIFWIFK